MLAQATGVYREQAVAGPLQDHFVCSWVHRLPEAAVRPMAIVPDGCIDLEWVAGSLRIAGPDREPRIESLAAGTTVVGFRFRPAAAAAWLRLSASETADRRIPLEEIWGREARRLAERARECRDIGALKRLLEAALTRRRPPVSSQQLEMRAAFELIAAGAPPGKPLVPWLSEKLGLSERTLRRRFEDAFGYGPKTLDRILRFQRFLKLVRGSRQVSAASLAAGAGYADQAHLIRESRRLAAATPREIAELLAERPA